MRSDSSIIPNYLTEEQLNMQIKKYFLKWRQNYIRRIPLDPKQYYVMVNNKGDTVSEALGYGMLILTSVSNLVQNTKAYFDGMFRYCNTHPSSNNPSLMSWKQIRRRDGSMHHQTKENIASATDADMDIACSLLHADRLWGSSGKINYKEEALKRIAAIMESLVNKAEWTLKLGDWVQNDKFETATRTSDWMIGHLHMFYRETGDHRWKLVMDKIQELISIFQSTYSKDTGLLPDFIWKQEGKWKPVHAHFLEGPHDSDYYYNACRIPWRLGEGYLITQNRQLKEQIEKINKWMKEITQQDASRVFAGYTLKGTPIVNNRDVAFIAPFAVSASVDRGNQSWLNNLWEEMTKEGNHTVSNYYGDSLRLLSMISVIKVQRMLEK